MSSELHQQPRSNQPQKRFARKSLILCTSLAVMGIGIARADDAPSPYADRIKDCKDCSANALGDLDQMLGDLKQTPDLIENDLPVFQQVLKVASDKYLAAADAYAKGDEAGGIKLLNEGHRLNDEEDILRQRIEARTRQRQFVVTQDAYELGINVPQSLQPYYEKDFESRKRAAEAWDRLANALTPDADPQTITQLRDAAYAATTSADLASWCANWAGPERPELENPQISSPELKQAEQQISDNEKRHMDDYRQYKAMERDMQKLDVEYRALQSQRDAAFNAAQQADKAKQ